MRNRNGFTLIELLVVITIITVLAGLLLPGIGKAMKQAKTNRTLSEMQHLATVIAQVYSEVGYYVPLEDLAKNLTEIKTTYPGKIWAWYLSTPPANTYSNGDNDNSTLTPFSATTLESFWAGPYTTYKNYVSLASPRPIDPWGTMGNSDVDQHQYRMFWTTQASVRPAGANGAMVIISAGPDKIYQCDINHNGNKAPVTWGTATVADATDFGYFDPISNDKGDDVYYIFNAGIQ